MSNTITLHLGRRFEVAELHLHLPATQEEIEEKLTWLDDYAEDPRKPVELCDVDCEIVGIRQYLRMADPNRDGELEKLNVLAEMDFERLGEDSMVEDGVRRTEFGLIRRISEPFPEETQGQQFGGY